MAETPRENRKRDWEGEFVSKRNQKEPEKEEEKKDEAAIYLDDFYYVDDPKFSIEQACEQVIEHLEKAIEAQRQVNHKHI